ncbi:MAG: prepilin-type N-terminal cleavage/methylation domain-containing protein [Desulfomonilia bacterium]
MDNVIIHSSHKKPGGFTLIELVIAILVFAIGIVGILKMHQASIQSNSFSMQLTEAMNISQDKFDYLRGLGVNNTSMSIGAHNPVIVTSMGVPYTVSWGVTSVSSGKNVTLNISWKEKAILHTITPPPQELFAP